MIAAVKIALVAAFASVVSLSSRAQDFPSRPLTFMIGLAPGGLTDTSARVYADALLRREGWKIVVENRAGAGGGLAGAAVQNAAPDGHTMLVFSGSQHATVAAINPNLYQPVKGFTPITLLFDSIVLFAVPKNSPAKTAPELFELGRGKPGGLTFGTQGVGSPAHLLAAQIAETAKVPVRFVHYRGGSAMMADFVAGRIDFAFPSLTSGSTFVADGQLRVLAVDAPSRLSRFAGIPTFQELGYGDQSVASWFAVATTAGTPKPVVAKLRSAFVAASNDPALRKRFADLETPVLTSTSEELGVLMAKETEKMERLVPALGLK